MTTKLETAPDRFEVEAVNKKENRPLYTKRVKIHPKRIYGLFRQLKWIIMVITLGIYYITPWLRWDRGAGVPDQAVLIDFPGRRFYFFFIEIWPHEVYYLAGMLIMAALGLFAVTSVVGRAWCGYACPQTVWTDLFIWVERLIEGDRGLFAYLKLQHEIDRAEAVYQLPENEKQALEKRVALLRPENLDIDMLEERSRDVLGLAHPDEIVIYTK